MNVNAVMVTDIRTATGTGMVMVTLSRLGAQAEVSAPAEDSAHADATVMAATDTGAAARVRVARCSRSLRS